MTDFELPENIVLEPLNEEMRCGIFTNSKGQVLIVHVQDIQSPVQWLEYDQHENKLFIIHENGNTQDLGLSVSAKMQSNLLQASEVILAKFADKKIQSSQKITLVIKDY